MESKINNNYNNSNKNNNNHSRNNEKCTKRVLGLPNNSGIVRHSGKYHWCCRAGPVKSQTGLSSRQELNSVMHRLRLEAGEWKESFTDARHERREHESLNFSVLNCVWCVWDWIHCWSNFGHLCCPLIPTGVTPLHSFTLGI